MIKLIIITTATLAARLHKTTKYAYTYKNVKKCKPPTITKCKPNASNKPNDKNIHEICSYNLYKASIHNVITFCKYIFGVISKSVYKLSFSIPVIGQHTYNNEDYNKNMHCIYSKLIKGDIVQFIMSICKFKIKGVV